MPDENRLSPVGIYQHISYTGFNVNQPGIADISFNGVMPECNLRRSESCILNGYLLVNQHIPTKLRLTAALASSPSCMLVLKLETSLCSASTMAVAKRTIKPQSPLPFLATSQ